MQSGWGHQDDGAKMGPQNVRDLVIKSDPRRFLTSYWYQSIDNFVPILFREAKKGGKSGSQGDQNDEKCETMKKKLLLGVG